MRNRNNVLVGLGVVFFIIGAALVFLVAGDDDDGGGTAAAPGTPGIQQVTVVIATEDIPNGASGDDIVAEELVEVETVDVTQRQEGAIASFGNLRGATFTQPVRKGQQILGAQVRQDPLAAGGIVVPEGFDAVAIELPVIPGVAGYAAPGTRINVYGVIPNVEGLVTAGGPVQPRVELLLTNVEVLDVNLTVPALRGSETAAPRPETGDTLKFLLALRPADVERAVLLSRFQELYFTIIRHDAGDSADTPGRSIIDLFQGTPASGAATEAIASGETPAPDESTEE